MLYEEKEVTFDFCWITGYAMRHCSSRTITVLKSKCTISPTHSTSCDQITKIRQASPEAGSNPSSYYETQYQRTKNPVQNRERADGTPRSMNDPVIKPAEVFHDSILITTYQRILYWELGQGDLGVIAVSREVAVIWHAVAKLRAGGDTKRQQAGIIVMCLI